MFYHAVLQVFVNFNQFLQREDPLIPVMFSQCVNFMKKLLGKFVTISAIKNAPNICSIDYMKKENLLPSKQGTNNKGCY